MSSHPDRIVSVCMCPFYELICNFSQFFIVNLDKTTLKLCNSMYIFRFICHRIVFHFIFMFSHLKFNLQKTNLLKRREMWKNSAWNCDEEDTRGWQTIFVLKNEIWDNIFVFNQSRSKFEWNFHLTHVCNASVTC